MTTLRPLHPRSGRAFGRWSPLWLSLIALLLGARVSAAQTTYTWRAGVTGNWSTPANWSPTGVPRALDRAIIANGTATLDSAFTVAKLTMTGGVVTGGGAMTVTDTLRWSAGTIRGVGGVTHVKGALMIEGTATKAFYERQIFADGTGRWTGTGGISCNLSAGLHIAGTLELASDAGVTGSAAGLAVTVEPGGTFVKTSPGTSTFGSSIALDNNGLVQIAAGTLRIGQGTSSGRFDIATGATLKMDQGTIAHRIVSGGSFTGGGLLAIANLLRIDTDLTIPVATAMMGNGADLGSTVSSKVTFTGPLDWALGRITGPGTLEIAPTSLLTISGTVANGSKVISERLLRNRGTIRWTDIGMFGFQNNGTLHNEGQIELRSDTRVSRATGSEASALVNRPGGVVRRMGATPTGRFRWINMPIQNEGGRIEVESGMLVVEKNNSICCGTFTQTSGTTRVHAGGTLTTWLGSVVELPNTTLILEGGSLMGNGTVRADVDNRGGTIRPGMAPDSTGVLTIDGILTQGAGGTTEIDLRGRTVRNGYDRLNILGGALGGRLQLRTLGGFVPGPSDQFTPVQWNRSLPTAQFAVIEGLQVAPDRLLKAVYTANALIVADPSVAIELISVRIDGRRSLRDGAEGRYYIVIGNAGLTPVLVPIKIRLPREQARFLPIDGGPEPDLSTPEGRLAELRRRVNFPIPDPPPGTEYPMLIDDFASSNPNHQERSFMTVVPPGGTTQIPVAATGKCSTPPEVQVMAGKPIDPNQVSNCLFSVSAAILEFVPGYDCVKAFIGVVSPAFQTATTGKAFDFAGYAANTAFNLIQCAGDLIPATKVIKTLVKVNEVLNKANGLKSSYDDCGGLLFPDEQTASRSVGLAVRCPESIDPNDKLAPQGIGTQHHVTPQDVLPYTILFENKAVATGAAQRVVVTDTLDVRHYDLDSFAFGDVTVADTVLHVAPGQQAFTLVHDLRPAKPLLLKVEGVLELMTGVVRWTFTSLDPVTNLPTEDADLGFLPPNRLAPEGEAQVTYTVRPSADLANGTRFGSAARIVFDNNPPIDTSRPTNTLDTGDPTSHVVPFTAGPSAGTIQVRWTGADPGGSGVRNYSVFVQRDGGPFVPWKLQTPDTIAAYPYEPGHRYGFYSTALDSVGRFEGPKQTAEATTDVLTGVGQDALPGRFELNQNAPNPFNPTTTIRYALPTAGRVRLSVYDTLGREVARLVDGPQTAGRHDAVVDGSGLASGVYLYRLTVERPGAERFIQVRRMVLLR